MRIGTLGIGILSPPLSILEILFYERLLRRPPPLWRGLGLYLLAKEEDLPSLLRSLRRNVSQEESEIPNSLSQA